MMLWGGTLETPKPREPRISLRRVLWRELADNPDFIGLWTAHTISVFGSQITTVALPLIAVLTLQATPSQMGILRMAQVLPALLFGLVAGAIIDRIRRRPVLIWTDVGRGVALGVLPLAAAVNLLRLELVYIVGFIVGIMTIFFDVARFSILPSIIARSQLTAGNSRLEASWSSAAILGPSLGGVLVQLLTAPIAILVDSLSFFASAAMLFRIRISETAPSSRKARDSIWVEIRAGLQFVLGNPLLRPLVMGTATFIIGYGMFGTIYILYLSRDLDLSPAQIGIVLASNGPGFLIGALVAERVAIHIGIGPAIVVAQLVGGCAFLAIPFTAGPEWIVVFLLSVASLVNGIAAQVSGVNQIALRQYITPSELLGRTNATMRFVSWSGAPLAALIAGIIGQSVGLRATLIIGAAITLAAVVPLGTSRIWSTRELSE